ncbi:hypothetical protein LY85_0767 [Clostridium sp. KNHs216]|nr:hypothetical protein LY85_0767 [Clostridium sp. KNHs216]
MKIELLSTKYQVKQIEEAKPFGSEIILEKRALKCPQKVMYL